MSAITVLALAVCTASAPGGVKPERVKLEAKVDSRVELISLIFRLSGAEEYNQPLAESPYSEEVDAHFGPYRDHAVVAAAQRLRADHGIGYDAPMKLAVHLEDTQSFGEKTPFDKEPPRLVGRWPVPEARSFVKLARAFAEETEFNKFFEDHRTLYRATAKRMSAQLEKRDYVKWFDAYFGARPGAKFYVIVGLLNGPCNYASGIQYPDGTEEIIPIIGAERFDKRGVPVFDERIDSTVVHEFCHSYTNPLVDKYARQLESPGRRLFAHCEQVMSAMAYGSWRHMMYETLVRTCVVRHILATDGKAAAQAEIEEQHGRGFRWVGEFSEVLARYEQQRERYATVDAFMPEVVTFFEGYAQTYEDLLAKERANAPKVVRIIPPNGATDVDPKLSEIKVFFDRPMEDGSWSVVGGGPEHPETVGEVHYDQDRRVFTMPVRLKPDWSYRFWLNRGRYNHFRSADGFKLECVEVTFSTRGK